MNDVGWFLRSKIWLPAVFVMIFPARGIAGSLECPELAHLSIKETARAMLAQRRALQDRGSSALPQIVYVLKAKHPQNSSGEITNYLLALYCPIVDANKALSTTDKKSKMNQFANEVRAEER